MRVMWIHQQQVWQSIFKTRALNKFHKWLRVSLRSVDGCGSNGSISKVQKRLVLKEATFYLGTISWLKTSRRCSTVINSHMFLFIICLKTRSTGTYVHAWQSNNVSTFLIMRLYLDKTSLLLKLNVFALLKSNFIYRSFWRVYHLASIECKPRTGACSQRVTNEKELGAYPLNGRPIMLPCWAKNCWKPQFWPHFVLWAVVSIPFPNQG